MKVKITNCLFYRQFFYQMLILSLASCSALRMKDNIQEISLFYKEPPSQILLGCMDIEEPLVVFLDSTFYITTKEFLEDTLDHCYPLNKRNGFYQISTGLNYIGMAYEQNLFHGPFREKAYQVHWENCHIDIRSAITYYYQTKEYVVYRFSLKPEYFLISLVLETSAIERKKDPYGDSDHDPLFKGFSSVDTSNLYRIKLLPVYKDHDRKNLDEDPSLYYKI